MIPDQTLQNSEPDQGLKLLATPGTYKNAGPCGNRKKVSGKKVSEKKYHF